MSAKHSMSLLAATACLIGCGTLVSRADTHYVWRDNPSPVSPFTNGWASASTQIQLAVDAADAPDVVLVTNGTYDTGGQPYPSYALTNRVYAAKAIMIRSMNGPEVTFIKGAAAPAGIGTTLDGCGSNAVRCALLRDASMIGFTLTNGHSMTNGNITYDQNGGGLLIRPSLTVVSNCVISGNLSWNVGGGVYVSYIGVLNNCTIAGNTATGSATCGTGGVAMYDDPNTPPRAVLNYCIVSNNISPSGGGVALTAGGPVMNHCTVVNNTAARWGAGGVGLNGRIYNCTIAGNKCGGEGGTGGGGVQGGGVISNCVISGNESVGPGGGVNLTSGDLKNCLLANNKTTTSGGGGAYLWSGAWTMDNCTIASNSASYRGGGVFIGSSGTMNNCVSWGNINAYSNIYIDAGSPTFTYTCSGPVQAGEGNTGADPQFAGFADGNYRLSANSPCLNTGTNQTWMTNSFDLDGQRRIDRLNGRVDMGAFEFINKITLFSGH